MNDKDQKYIGYFKYQGKLVEDGSLDARKAADALIGIDNILRYFICQECPSLVNVDFEIPVRIQKGSWEALIPNMDSVYSMLSLAGAAYLASSAKKMADNDFKDIGFRSIVSNSIKSICWVVKLACHVGTTKKKEFKKTLFITDDDEVVIRNSNN